MGFLATAENADRALIHDVELTEVLRLLGCFAKRSNHFAQDDTLCD
jgi:hypothetical protein